MRNPLFTLLLIALTFAPVHAQPAPLGSTLSSAQQAIDSLSAPPADMPAAVARLRTDLANERVTALDGSSTTLLAKLESLPDTVLSGAQKTRVENALAEIYEMNLRLEASIPAGAPGKGYQLVNWQHTRSEVNEVIDSMMQYNASAAQAGKPLLTSAQLEDTMLAAAFSDSVKLPPGPTGNFFQHHLDGAQAAKNVVERYYPGDTARLNDIVAAIQEHQIAPPQFMGTLARGAMVGKQKGGLTAAFQKAVPEPTVAETAAFQGLLGQLDAATAVNGARTPLALTADQTALLAKIGVQPESLSSWATAVNGARDRIADPLVQPRTADGTRVAFSPEEAAALKGIGIDSWILPQPGSSHAQVSDFVRIADARANYMSSPAGLAKIVAIRGPGTPFADKTIWDSVASAESSFQDAMSVIPAEDQPALNALRARTLTQLDGAKADLDAWVAQNKASAGYAPDEPVLFLDPNASTAGLTAEQIAQRTDFAKQIRGQLESGLRGRQDAWANVGSQPYDAEALGTKMAAQAAGAGGEGAPAPIAEGTGTTPLAKGTGASSEVAGPSLGGVAKTGEGAPAPVAEGAGTTAPGAAAEGAGAAGEAAADGTLLGVKMATVEGAAAHTAQGAAIGAAAGVAVEAGRELLTDGRVDGKTLWNNTVGNLSQFWKPLAGGTAGAMLAGAVAARLIPGGGLIAAGAQFFGGSLGASAAGGQLAQSPGRSVAGAVGSAAGSVALGALLSPIPGGTFVGGLVGGIAGQVAGEWVYDRLKGTPAPQQVAARPKLRGMTI